MSISSVLDKFAAVEITNASRISDDELAFCTAQQALYEKVLEHHRDTFAALVQLANNGAVFMSSVTADNECRHYGETYPRYREYKIEADLQAFAKDNIGEIHEKFISIIIDYFNKKYGTAIEQPGHKMLLGLEKPTEPSFAFSGFREISDEEKEQRRTAQQAYEDAIQEYWYNIIYSDLEYNALLDHIFISLDGSTFAERAEQEIKDGSRNASSSYGGKLNYEIKNKKISLDILYPRKSWNGTHEVDLSRESYHAILRALTYFDSGKGQTQTYSSWLSRFTGYTFYERDGIFSAHSVGREKIESFRYFKNGKFEVTFDSHTSATAFARDYLFRGEAGDAAA